MNPMEQVRIEKVTVNMGVGQAGEELKRAEEIITRVTNAKPIQTLCKVRQPAWGLRLGLPIGVKVTLRGAPARKFLETALKAKDQKIKVQSFDKFGNFAFGVKEYIDMPGAKYDPKLGIKGFDVLVTLQKPGYRIKHRLLQNKRVPQKHRVSKDEAVEFAKKEFGVQVE